MFHDGWWALAESTLYGRRGSCGQEDGRRPGGGRAAGRTGTGSFGQGRQMRGSLSPAAIRLSRSRRNLQAQMLTSSAWTGGVGMEFVVVLVGLRGGGGSALSLVVTGLPDVTAPAPAAVAVAGVPDVAVVLLLSKPLSDSVERDNSSSCWTPACDSRSSSCSRSCCSKRWTLRSSKTSLISRWN